METLAVIALLTLVLEAIKFDYQLRNDMDRKHPKDE